MRATNADGYALMLMAFPVIGLIMSALGAACTPLHDLIAGASK